MLAFDSFFATDGYGCDAIVEKTVRRGMNFGSVSTQQLVRQSDRCSAPPCVWLGYSHREAPGCVLGVRACPDHVGIAGDEELWNRQVLSPNVFAVWEVMTS